MGATAAVAIVSTLVSVDSANRAKKQAKDTAFKQEKAQRQQEDTLAENEKKNTMTLDRDRKRSAQKAIAAGSLGKSSTIMGGSDAPASMSASSGYGGGTKTILGS